MPKEVQVETPVKLEAPVGPYNRPLREMELYHEEPPLINGEKFPLSFNLRKQCGMKDEKIPTGRCQAQLVVYRVKNTKFVRDDGGYGGQLAYDEKDVRQYISCPIHGPFPAGPESW